MTKSIVFLTLLCAATSFAQTTDQSQSQRTKDEVTVTGCVSRMNSNFILMQPGHSYQLQETKQLKVAPYLGQEVEVTGAESASMPTSSSPKATSASPLTITVHSIKTIHKRCSAN